MQYEINAHLDRLTEENLRRAVEEPEWATQRLAKLEHEWELDRAVMVAFAAMGSVALVLGLRKNWRWRFPLMGQITFLLLHSMARWSPPALVLRRLGFRTGKEIAAERAALAKRVGLA